MPFNIKITKSITISEANSLLLSIHFLERNMDESLFAHYDETQAIFINDLLVAPFVFLFILLYAKNKLKHKKINFTSFFIVNNLLLAYIGNKPYIHYRLYYSNKFI